MNKRFIRSIESLCARTEDLQARFTVPLSNNEFKVLDCLSRAKTELMRALREAERDDGGPQS